MTQLKSDSPIKKRQIEEFGIADIAGLIAALEYGRVTEIPTGIINGVNQVFYTSVPFVSGTISVFLNGLKEGGFAENTDTRITMDIAPKVTGFTDSIEVIYTKKII